MTAAPDRASRDAPAAPPAARPDDGRDWPARLDLARRHRFVAFDADRLPRDWDDDLAALVGRCFDTTAKVWADVIAKAKAAGHAPALSAQADSPTGVPGPWLVLDAHPRRA
jgi:hypothetical protein